MRHLPMHTCYPHRRLLSAPPIHPPPAESIHTSSFTPPFHTSYPPPPSTKSIHASYLHLPSTPFQPHLLVHTSYPHLLSAPRIHTPYPLLLIHTSYPQIPPAPLLRRISRAGRSSTLRRRVNAVAVGSEHFALGTELLPRPARQMTFDTRAALCHGEFEPLAQPSQA